MKKLMLCLVALAALVAPLALRAQDIAGDWQGTIKAGNKDLRLVVRVTKDDGRLKAVMFSIDQAGGQPINASSASLEGTTFKFKIDMVSGSYEGKLGADGKSIAGTWTQGGQPFPLTLIRATPETAWDIPEAPKPQTPMAADADPSFDVATIKPNPSGETHIQGLTLNGRDIVVRNGSLADLIGAAYSVQTKQIVNGPGWMESDRYDIHAIPDQPGTPNLVQFRSILRKLLEDRYQLKIHHEKRDLSAYVLTVGKTGQKLTPTQVKGNLPGFGASPGTGGLTLHLINGTMTDFTDFLQMIVLDKPVVNRTGITGRFDNNVTFTPEDWQFNGHPPKIKASDVSEAPNLFDAIQQQLGLKLTAEKTAVDVIVIDHVEKPSPN
jgi:uncharacterized protein (TIGR03435 family)